MSAGTGGRDVHITIDRVVLRGLSRAEGREVIAALRTGLEAAYGAGGTQPTGPTGPTPASGRAAGLGREAARRIAAEGRP